MEPKISLYHIDDDPRIIRYVQEVLATSNQIVWLGGTQNQQEGVTFVQQHSPNILLLDIEMPGLSGMGIARQLEKYPVKIVFLTNHKDFAIEAFHLNVLHYLLKPAAPDELDALANRYINTLQNHTIAPQPVAITTQLAIKTTTSIEFIPIEDILYIHAAGSYSCIYCTGQPAQFTSSKNLGHYEHQLMGHTGFIRISKSYIINKAQLRRITKSEQETLFEFTGKVSFQLKSFHKENWDELNML